MSSIKSEQGGYRSPQSLCVAQKNAMVIDFIAINFDPGPDLGIQYPNCCPLLSVWPNLSYSQDGRGVQYQFEFIPGLLMEECVFIVCKFCAAIIKQLDIQLPQRTLTDLTGHATVLYSRSSNQ